MAEPKTLYTEIRPGESVELDISAGDSLALDGEGRARLTLEEKKGRRARFKIEAPDDVPIRVRHKRADDDDGPPSHRDPTFNSVSRREDQQVKRSGRNLSGATLSLRGVQAATRGK